MVSPTGSSGSTSSTSSTSSAPTVYGPNGTVINPSGTVINFSGIASGINTAQIIQEMLSIDRQPEQIYQQDQQLLTARETQYNAVSAQLLMLQSAGSSLDQLQSFALVTANSNNTNAVTVTAQAGAQTGSHSIAVNNLAQAQMITLAPQTSQTAPLNVSGQILINGKTISLNSADSLQSLASNINAAGAGVTASIITPTQGQYYLTIGSNNSGVQGQMSLADVNGASILTQLGVTGTGGHFVHTLSNGVGSDLFSDSATPVATLQGQPTAPNGTVQIQLSNGTSQNVNIDLGTSLTQIASTINTAFGSSVASVQSVTNPITGTASQQLQLSGVSAVTDSNSVLADLGIYQSNLAPKSQLTQAQDASFTLDGIAATRPTNTFSDAISGVTINLLQPTGAAGSTSSSGTPSGPATITIASDTKTIQANIDAFAKAYNTTVDLVNSQSQYDSTTGQTGTLFGDPTISNMMETLASQVSGQVSGLSSKNSLLSQIGITLDNTGHLIVNDNALSQALSSNLQGVAQLLQASATASNPNVQFVSSGANTQPSPSSGYAVNITQPATQAQYTVAAPQTQPLLTSETLTFAGSLFGTSNTTTTPLTGPSITLQAGSTSAGIVSQINADPVIGAQVSASLNSSGALQLTSKLYGSSAAFDVVSTVGAAANSSGIGNTVQQAAGLDVAGTINGETSTGQGQFLTDTQTGANGTGAGLAAGLQVRVAATNSGSYGTIQFTTGVADMMKNFINTQTDPYSGVLTTAVTNMQTQYTNDQNSIGAIEASLALEQTNLQNQFNNMEMSVQKIQASSAGLSQFSTSLLPGLPGG